MVRRSQAPVAYVASLVHIEAFDASGTFNRDRTCRNTRAIPGTVRLCDGSIRVTATFLTIAFWALF
jgi:hypothetical protein